MAKKKKLTKKELRAIPVSKLVLKKDRDWGEYQVRVYRGSHLDEGATFHTDDKEDAVRTMEAMKREYGLAGLAGRRRLGSLGESPPTSTGDLVTMAFFGITGIAILGGLLFVLPLLKGPSEEEKRAAALRAAQNR